MQAKKYVMISVLVSTLLMLGVIQGIHLIIRDEEKEFEREKRRKDREKEKQEQEA